jgi:hypothetical protein
MTRASTTPERLARIETLLETAVVQRAEDLSQRDKDREAMRNTIEDMAADIKSIKSDLAADKAELASLKNKGVGLLVGAGLAGGATWEAVKALFGVIGK